MDPSCGFVQIKVYDIQKPLDMFSEHYPHHPCLVYLPGYIYHKYQPFMQVDIPVPWMVWVIGQYCGESGKNNSQYLILPGRLTWNL